MPLILDPTSISDTVLDDLRKSLRSDLQETLELALHPHGTIRDEASLRTAVELVRAALDVIDRPGARSRAEMAGDANLAYAAMLAAIDLVKSHTDVPRVPKARQSSR